MKKTQVLFAMIAMIVSANCAIPLAHVEAQQELPRATSNGCAYSGQSGNGNYARVNGLAYDAGDFFDKAAAGNMGVINACADLDMAHSYGKMYESYSNNVLYASASGQNDEGLKKDLDNTKAAVRELSDNVVDLATNASPQVAGTKSKLTVIGKLDKGKQEPAPAISPAPTPAANPTPIDPTIVGRIRLAHNNADLIGILRGAAYADSARAPMFNSLADAVLRGSEDSFGQNQKTLVEAFVQQGGSR